MNARHRKEGSTNTPLRVLIVEDSEDDTLLLLRHLQRGGYEPSYERVFTADALSAVLDQPWDIIIADYAMPQFSGLVALKMVRERGLDLPFILVSGTMGEDTAVAAMKAGANDYLMKDKLARLVPAVDRELREAAAHRARLETTHALDELRHQHESLLEAAGEGICGLDVKGNITFINTSGANMVGWAPEALVGKPLHDVLHHSMPDRTRFPKEDCSLCATLEDGLTHWMDDEVFWRRDGTSFPVEYICNPIRQEGNVVGAVLTFKDISKRRQAERALRESEERFQGYMDNSPVVAFMKDEQGRYSYINRPFERAFKTKLSEMRGKTDSDVWPADVCREIQQHDTTVLQRNKVMGVIETLPGPDGRPHQWLAFKFPIRDSTGRRFLGGVAIDITDQSAITVPSAGSETHTQAV